MKSAAGRSIPPLGQNNWDSVGGHVKEAAQDNVQMVFAERESAAASAVKYVLTGADIYGRLVTTRFPLD